MARSTGPILAVGAVTLANKVILNQQPMDWRIPIATGLAAGFFAVFERGWESGAVGLAWLALVVTVILPIDRSTPSPIETLDRLVKGQEK